MNVIEKTRDILQSFPKISEVCGHIHVDFADPEPTSYGLSSMGDSLLKEDVLGNQTRRHNFMFYSTFGGINDFERQENSSALLELANWLPKQTGGKIVTDIGGELFTGEITKISAENGMLYAVPQENETDGMQYQLQITTEYTVENKEDI